MQSIRGNRCVELGNYKYSYSSGAGPSDLAVGDGIMHSIFIGQTFTTGPSVYDTIEGNYINSWNINSAAIPAITSVLLDLSYNGAFEVNGGATGVGNPPGHVTFVYSSNSDNCDVLLVSLGPNPTVISGNIGFTKDVVGFDATKITVTNGTITQLVSTNNNFYGFDLTPDAGTNVVVSIQILAGAVLTATGQPNTASRMYQWTVTS